MKPALRYIPTEVWLDVFCYPWISRKRLGEIVDEFGNRYFAEMLQYCLHGRGKQTLGELQLNEDGIYKKWEPYTEKLDIVQSPMPENIKLFERIEIKHLDSSTLSFLRQISILFTDNDVNLSFGPADRPVLDHLSSMVHGIHSLSFEQDAIPLAEEYFTAKLAQIKLLTIYFGLEQHDQATIQTRINFCMNWLTSEERDPAEPRLLTVYYYCAENLQQFCKAIKQQFLLAKNPCSFAIGFIWHDNDNHYHDHIANFHLENDLGEQLDGQFVDDEDFWIYRHKQVDFARTQLVERLKEYDLKSYKSNCIEIYDPVTIGGHCRILRTLVPENIKSFKSITIWHFDSSTLAFLRNISTLFNDMNLEFDGFKSSKLIKLHIILDNLAPMLHGINSLEFNQPAIPLVQQYFSPKLAQIKLISLILKPDDNDEPFDPAQTVNFCLNWLNSEQQDQTAPKFLEVYFCSNVYQQFSMAVQQQFQSAKRPSSFVIKFYCYDHFGFQLDLLENNIGEQLHGQFDEKGNFWIFRQQADYTKTQLEEWVKGAVEKRNKSSGITLFPLLTIGQIETIAGGNEVDDNTGEGGDGPSTSKKAKMT